MTAALSLGSLAGCSTKNPAPSDGETVGAQNEESGGEKKDTLTVALTSEPPSLTTCDHDSIVGVYMNLLTYNGLMRVDHETLEVVPDLAESYTVENETDWTFVLKDGIKFHDGSDCTAGCGCQYRMGKNFPRKR